MILREGIVAYDIHIYILSTCTCFCYTVQMQLGYKTKKKRETQDYRRLFVKIKKGMYPPRLNLHARRTFILNVYKDTGAMSLKESNLQ